MNRRLLLMLVACALVFGAVFGFKWYGNRMMNQAFDNLPVPPRSNRRWGCQYTIEKRLKRMMRGSAPKAPRRVTSPGSVRTLGIRKPKCRSICSICNCRARCRTKTAVSRQFLTSLKPSTIRLRIASAMCADSMSGVTRRAFG